MICKLEVTGRVVLDALNHGVEALPNAAGQFPQVSGLTMVVDTKAAAGNRVRDVRVNGAPLDSAQDLHRGDSRFPIEGRRRLHDVQRIARAGRTRGGRPDHERARTLRRGGEEVGAEVEGRILLR